MQNYFERMRMWGEGWWQRFILLAQGPHALLWLAVCAITDPIFFPIPPELYLTALILAHPVRWKTYVAFAIPFSVMGAGLGYLVGAFLFGQIGLPLIHFYHLEGAFMQAQQIFQDKVFIAMVLFAFSLIPEKVVVLTAGFLGVSFPPFLFGFFIGRAVRITLISYFVWHFGGNVLAIIKRYSIIFTVLLVIAIAYYVIVHYHILPL